jgi:hypothetical protein
VVDHRREARISGLGESVSGAAKTACQEAAVWRETISGLRKEVPAMRHGVPYALVLS